MEQVDQRQNLRLIKIAGIVGSPHKDGMTSRLVQQALAGAKAAGAEVLTLFLADEAMQPCQGCDGNCWETGECVQGSIFPNHRNALQESDGLVMGVPVYCWQMNSMTHLFIDKMRWDTGSVLEPHNRRAAFGIACAGGSGTGCIMALQALYRYFYNWAFHGISPLPVTRFNYGQALQEAYVGGRALTELIRECLRPFPDLGAALADLEALPFMRDGPVDELHRIVQQLLAGLPATMEPLVQKLHAEAKLASKALERGDRRLAAVHDSRAYACGSQAWSKKNFLAESQEGFSC
jgi:multimeric flavodoxin WrbA